MTRQRILVTGASGCIGHYLAEALIQETDHEIFLLVRNPDKLKLDIKAYPHVTILQADLREIEQFSAILQTIHCAVLAATSWGGAQEVFEVNVTKTVQLVSLLNPEVCQQVIYFSTASILDPRQELLKEAGEIGTDYIRSKYVCLQQLSQLELAPRIITLFPTLVFGGDGQKPYSHLSAGLPEIMRWINLARFLKTEGSFHFMHSRDIAQVVTYLINHPDTQVSERLVLGNQELSVNQCIEAMCAHLNKRIYFRLNLSFWLANLIITLFQIQMAPWDRFCMNYRYFSYQNPVNPSSFGLATYCPTISDLLRVSGISPYSASVIPRG